MSPQTIFHRLVHAAFDLLFSPGSMFSLYSLATALLLGCGALLLSHRARRGRFGLKPALRAVFARRLLTNASTRADLFYTFVSVFALGGLIGWGQWSDAAIAGAVARRLNAWLGQRPALDPQGWGLRLAVTLSGYFAYEFGYWLDHTLKHRIALLWEVHKTHHTAEVLTPLTNFRVHPLDTLIFANVVALCVGPVQGVVIWLAGVAAPTIAIDGSNIILVFFIYTLAHLQHSQFWIAFPGVWGKIFISPAQHQIHHSADPAHYNSNCGAFLALFDWAFGSLTLPPKQNPHLRFGVIDNEKRPHSIETLLLGPIYAIGARLLARRSDAVQQPAE